MDYSHIYEVNEEEGKMDIADLIAGAMKRHIEEYHVGSRAAAFVPPTLEEVAAAGKAYCKGKNLLIVDYQGFYDYFESNGWMVGRVKMKKWTSALYRWIREGDKRSRLRMANKEDLRLRQKEKERKQGYNPNL